MAENVRRRPDLTEQSLRRIQRARPSVGAGLAGVQLVWPPEATHTRAVHCIGMRPANCRRGPHKKGAGPEGTPPILEPCAGPLPSPK
jgi:hypothetical protein